MIPVTCFKNEKIAVFGLGGSGLAAAKALKMGGALVLAWDDREAGQDAARAADIPVYDLRDENWREISALVLAPGVPLTHPRPHWVVEKAHAAGVEVIGDTELFFRQKQAVQDNAPSNRSSGAKVVAITGTNGKSTTTALVAHMLRHAGHKVAMGGNIGKPVLELEPFNGPRFYVIEFSSYQIDLTPSLAPEAAILLNISPDHLDRHGTLQNYARIKGRVFAQLEADGLAVIGVDDDICSSISGILTGSYDTVRVSNARELSDGITGIEGVLRVMSGGDARNTLDLGNCTALRGRHNWQNAAAAFAVGRHFGLSHDDIAAGFASFPGLAHRMEEVGRNHNILYINDSKATNADSASHALSAFDNIYWIAGGRAKSGGITELAPYFPRVRKAYLVGEAASAFAATLSAPPQPADARHEADAIRPVPHELSGTLEVAVAQASRDASARPDESAVILLSPACASFDQFRSFEERGDRFRELVNALTATGAVAHVG